MGTRITIQNKGAESSSPIVIDLNKKSSEASTGGTVLRILESVTSNGILNAIVTIFNRIVSLGTYSSIDELKSSNKVLNAISSKTKGDLTLSEVKESIRNIFVNVGYGDEAAEKKTARIYFICWLFGVAMTKMHSGDYVSQLGGDYKLTTVNVDGKDIPVCIAKLKFGRNTVDVSGIVGQSLCVINTFYKDASGKLKTTCIGKCYLKNASANLTGSESFSIIPTNSGLEFAEDF